MAGGAIVHPSAAMRAQHAQERCRVLRDGQCGQAVRDDERNVVRPRIGNIAVAFANKGDEDPAPFVRLAVGPDIVGKLR